MSRPGYTSVAIDNETLDLLRQLSEVARMTKASYLRFLIFDQAARHGIVDANPVVTVRDGHPVTMSELSPVERGYTKTLDALGVKSNLGIRRRLKGRRELQRLREAFTVLDELVPGWETDTVE